MENEECPLDAKLEAVLPGVHQRFQIARQDMATIENTVVTGFSDVQKQIQDGFKHITDSHQSVLLESSVMIGNSLVNAGQTLIQSPRVNKSPGTEELQEGTGANEPARSPGSNLNQLFRAEGDPQQTEEAVPTFRFKNKHGSLMSIWNEWFGLNEYEDGMGGVAGRNEKLGRKWRKEANLDASQYSRHQRLVVAIGKEAGLMSQQPEDVIADWEPLYAGCNYSAGNLVKGLQQVGKIPTKKARGKNKSNA